MKSSAIVVGVIGFLSILPVPSSLFADTQTLTFQDGDGGAYSTTQAAEIGLLNGTGNGSGATMTASVTIYLSDLTQTKRAFVRFPNIIGDNPGQIAAGSTIQEATLQLTRVNYSVRIAVLNTVSTGWDENTITGNSPPDMLDPSVGSIPAGDTGPYVATITDVVQAWATGAPNWGLAISTDDSPTVISESFYADDETTVSFRPLLTVTFTTPTATEATTWGKVKALYR